MLPLQRISSEAGDKVLVAGANVVKISGFTSKADGTSITGIKVSGVALANMNDFWPAGTTFDKGDMFLFPLNLDITEITIAAGGSIIAFLRS